MKTKSTFRKEYEGEIPYRKFLRKIEKESINIPSENNSNIYLNLNKNHHLSKIEIYHENLENHLPYSVIAEIEKQGTATEIPSEIEDILIKEGFKKIENKKD